MARPPYVSVSVRLMHERILVAQYSIEHKQTFYDYIDHYGGPQCYYDEKYLKRYTIGVKLNAWLIDVFST